ECSWRGPRPAPCRRPGRQAHGPSAPETHATVYEPQTTDRREESPCPQRDILLIRLPPRRQRDDAYFASGGRDCCGVEPHSWLFHRWLQPDIHPSPAHSRPLRPPPCQSARPAAGRWPLATWKHAGAPFVLASLGLASSVIPHKCLVAPVMSDFKMYFRNRRIHYDSLLLLRVCTAR